MKLLTTALTTFALTFSASAMADSSSQLTQDQAKDSLVKKLTMSCYRNREGDRLFVGAAETVRFCRNAAKQTVASAFEQSGVELASMSQQTAGESIN
jgi:hypothetical protein